MQSSIVSNSVIWFDAQLDPAPTPSLQSQPQPQPPAPTPVAGSRRDDDADVVCTDSEEEILWGWAGEWGGGGVEDTVDR